MPLRESASFLKGMRVLVTGGAGYVGGALVRRLVHDGVAPVIVDDLSTGTCPPPGLRVHVVDLSRNRLEQICEYTGVCFHLACRNIIASVNDPELDLAGNALGTMRLMQTLRDVAPQASVVYTSSASVYGDATPPFREDQAPRCRTPYSVSKLAAEGYTHLYRPSATILRLSNVFGPGQRADNPCAAVATRFMAAAERGEQVEIHGDGSQTRDFTYIDDVVDALLLAARHQHGGLYNIGTGVETTVLALAHAVLRAVHGAGRDPRSFVRVVAPRAMLDSITVRCVDVARAAKDLGWRSQTTVEEGLRLWREAACA